MLSIRYARAVLAKGAQGYFAVLALASFAVAIDSYPQCVRLSAAAMCVASAVILVVGELAERESAGTAS